MRLKYICLGVVAVGILLAAILMATNIVYPFVGELIALVLVCLPAIRLGNFRVKISNDHGLGREVSLPWTLFISAVGSGVIAWNFFQNLIFDAILVGPILATIVYTIVLYPLGTYFNNGLMTSGRDPKSNGKTLAERVAKAAALPVTGVTSGPVTEWVNQDAGRYRDAEEVRKTEAVNPEGEKA